MVRGWGEVHQGRSLVYRPDTPEGVAAALDDAAARGLTVAHRGAGFSYGDLAVNEGGAVLDLSGLSGLLEFDEHAGLVRARARGPRSKSCGPRCCPAAGGRRWFPGR